MRGHLLNDNIGGPGRAHNLTPFTRHVNTSEHLPVETQLKAAIRANKFVRYGVRVTYGHAPRSATKGLERRVRQNGGNRGDGQRLRIMQEEERVVAKRVDLKWSIKDRLQDLWGSARRKNILVELPSNEPALS